MMLNNLVYIGSIKCDVHFICSFKILSIPAHLLFLSVLMVSVISFSVIGWFISSLLISVVLCSFV